MYNSEEILEIINQGLANLDFECQPSGLYKPIRYVLGIGGKRLRPVMMLLAYNMYDQDVESILPTALGLEMYHNFTLLHDDVMDRAEVRRGNPCVHKVWNENTAILSGDAMIVLAYRLISQCRPDCFKAVFDLFTQTAIEIDEGQQYDVDFESRMDVSVDEYIEMIRLKTSVLLACALKMGAIQAHAPAQNADLLYRFGEKIGLAFQLQDDLLDVYGDSRIFGKRIGGDIVCNKKTYMLINALACAERDQYGQLVSWINATAYDEQEKIAAVTRIYDEIGVRRLCEERINSYFDEAKSLLDEISLPEEKKESLWRYVVALLGRKS